MRVTILHMRYRPDATGTGPLVAELATDLAALGEDVTVITTQPHYGAVAGGSRTLRNRGLEAGVRVVRTAAFPYASSTVAGRSIDYALYTLLATAAGMSGAKPDVILAIAPPITVGLSGWLLGLVRGAPLVFNAQDIWPDGLVSMGKLRSRPIIAAFHALERFIYRASRRVTVLSEGMKDNLRRKGVPAEKVTVLPNWVDINVIRPEARETRLRTELGLDDRFVVLFAGNFGFAAALESVLEAARHLRQERDAIFLVVGEGSAKARLVKQARELQLENVRFVTTQPAERLSELFGTADLSLVTLLSTMGTLSVPSKAMAIMASSRPILASVPADSEIRRIVEESQSGVWVPPEDPRALAQAIQELKQQKDKLESLGRNGRSYAVAHLSRGEIVGKYHHLLQEVAREGR